MVAYLVAGVIVGGLVWALRHGPALPKLPTMLVYATAGAVIGGLSTNLLRDEGLDHIDALGFTVAALASLLVSVGVQFRGSRGD